MALDKKLVIRIEQTEFHVHNGEYSGYSVTVTNSLDTLTIRNFVNPNKDDEEKFEAARTLVTKLRQFFVLWTDEIEVREFPRG